MDVAELAQRLRTRYFEGGGNGSRMQWSEVAKLAIDLLAPQCPFGDDCTVCHPKAQSSSAHVRMSLVSGGKA